MKLCKRLLSCLLVAAMLMVNFPSVARAAGTYENLTYEITDGEVTITGYTSDVSEYLLIPETIEGYPVTAIGDDAFNGSKLYFVSIPKGVTQIGRAFYVCFELETIAVDQDNPNYSTGYPGVLFNKDKTVLIQAPDAISGSYTIPDSVITIWNQAFEVCKKLTSVTIPDEYSQPQERREITQKQRSAAKTRHSSDSFCIT